jgi:hypothetical protein
MRMPKCIAKLFDVFPGAFINSYCEFIAHPRSNLYFRLEDVETHEDVVFKLLAWCSRAACKSQPFGRQRANDRYNETILKAINNYCGTEFTQDEMMDIYTRFGNAVNEQGCRKFIKEAIGTWIEEVSNA